MSVSRLSALHPDEGEDRALWGALIIVADDPRGVRSSSAVSRSAEPSNGSAAPVHANTHAIEYPSRYGEAIRCIAVFETDGDLPGIKPVGAAYRGRAMVSLWVAAGASADAMFRA